MKKIITILLLSVYLTLSVGLNIMVHTCGGESEAMLATNTVEDPCGCDDVDPADKCCTTEVTSVKLSDEQKSSIITTSEQLTVASLVPLNSVIIDRTEKPGLSFLFLSSFSPPPNNDLCIVNSVFLI